MERHAQTDGHMQRQAEKNQIYQMKKFHGRHEKAMARLTKRLDAPNRFVTSRLDKIDGSLDQIKEMIGSDVKTTSTDQKHHACASEGNRIHTRRTGGISQSEKHAEPFVFNERANIFDDSDDSNDETLTLVSRSNV